ncbi:hypothetical protein 2 [Wenzhou picorna-like virus 7]|uniref:hypothetical protein 2 n=1 Tax=Wenzhou picorna-like virus 7 TaxID=1923644 RepID=UPI00090CC6B5|nr:hypothetical protein 2 [Wenzhou picorna-like virus 7]APG78056.1 hypothetical protein 2 [Wenzhou picorna-like virus 7]
MDNYCYCYSDNFRPHSGVDDDDIGSVGRVINNVFDTYDSAKSFLGKTETFTWFDDAILSSSPNHCSRDCYYTTDFVVQSGEERVISMTNNELKTSNLKFSDEQMLNAYSVQPSEDVTRKSEDTSDVQLSDFFKRPVKIREYEWGTGTTLSQIFDPWELFFNNKRVSNRISNFNLMRSRLYVRAVLNGNGFQYGRAILAYNAMDAYDSFRPTSIVTQDITQLSQLPHVYLNPTTSQGGEMVLPFFYHFNSVKQPDTDYNELGQCYLESINALKHANGATDKVTISIFAWAEDITLAVPTSKDSSALIPQSGEEVDEANLKGVVSGPASAIGKAASSLKDVPVIGKYAIATSMIAGTTAKVAKALGYCRPPVNKNPEPFRNFPTSSLALTSVPDNAQKLTVDDKQELTIDPGISGISSGDVLSIASIASRESYLTQFTWAVGAAPETLLWNARVSPVTWAETGSAYHFPACCMAALPFEYWRGTMNFRFQVVASNYHKGRLRIAYDPNFFDVSPEYNVNYMHIIDIAENNDFTISVSNGQRVSLIDHHKPGLDSSTQLYSSTRYTNEEEGNGVLQVSVLNELTVPNSVINNDIEINVFVSMGDDFEVFVPDDHFQHFVFKPQSGEEIEFQSGEEAVDSSKLDSKPIEDDIVPVNGTMDTPAELNLVYTGESIKSFRTMLKRYNLHYGISPLDTFHNVLKLKQNAFPFLRGNVAGAVHTTAALAPYNYCNTLLLHWITNAFSGWRGSLRWKFLPRGGWEHITSTLERYHSVNNDQYEFVIATPSAPVTQSQAAAGTVAVQTSDPTSNNVPLQGKTGMVYANSKVNPCLEVEVPFYSQARFVPGRVENWTSTLGVWDRVNESFVYKAWGNSLEGESSYIDLYCAAGEDYQVYFFKGLPRMYYEASPPVA